MCNVMKRQFRRAVKRTECTNMDSMLLSEYADLEWSIGLHRFTLELIGIWPREDANLRDRCRSTLRMCGIIIGIVSFCTAPSFCSLLIVWGDITAVIDNMMFTLPAAITPMKLLIIWWKRATLSPVITMITHDWIKSKSTEERDSMISYAQKARVIIICSYTVQFTAIALTYVLTAFGYNLRYVTNLTASDRPLPLQGYYAFETTTSPRYEIMFLTQTIVGLLMAISYTSVDNFLALLMFHICGQFENLTSRLHQMRASDHFVEALRNNVEDHTRLIRSVTAVEDGFTLMLLLLFLYMGFIFCIYGFLFITVTFDDEDVSIKKTAFLTIAICFSLLHTGLYCAAGELLVAKYEDVYNAVYECEWYKLETREAKNLILLLIRTNKPLYITAGRIIPMTMSTFCKMLKTSSGYMSVLLANKN